MATEENGPGPVSYLIAEFPGNNITGEGLAELLDLVDHDVIRVLDLLFVARDTDGSVAAVDLRDIDGDGVLDLTVFEGATSGLMDDRDLAEAGSVIEPGSSAAVVIFENRWAAPFAHAMRRNGAQIVAAGFIPQDDIVAAVEAIDAVETVG